MTLTFENLIAHNKRVSILLVAGIVILCSLLGGMFAQLVFTDNLFFYTEVFLIGALFGTAFSLIIAGCSYYLGDRVIAFISSAREIKKADDPMLFNVVEEMAIAAGLPMPRVYLIPDRSPNAFAAGRDPKHAIVGITAGLRSKLNRDELQAVIAHEMAHIKNYDILLMMLIGVLAGVIVLISDVMIRGFARRRGVAVSRSGSRGGSSNKGGGAVVIIVIIGLFFAWLAPLIARFLQLAVSREREYLADSTAVQLCRNPSALASALNKIANDPIALKSDNRATEHMFIINPDPKRRLNNANKDSIWSTHPPLNKRIALLRKLAGEIETQNFPV